MKTHTSPQHTDSWWCGASSLSPSSHRAFFLFFLTDVQTNRVQPKHPKPSPTRSCGAISRSDQNGPALLLQVPAEPKSLPLPPPPLPVVRRLDCLGLARLGPRTQLSHERSGPPTYHHHQQQHLALHAHFSPRRLHQTPQSSPSTLFTTGRACVGVADTNSHLLSHPAFRWFLPLSLPDTNHHQRSRSSSSSRRTSQR
ncbi:unnamed protein product [Ectocarpus fasciculatus]